MINKLKKQFFKSIITSKEKYKIIRREITGIACTIKNDLLFERAKLLAKDLDKVEDLKWIETQLESYKN